MRRIIRGRPAPTLVVVALLLAAGCEKPQAQAPQAPPPPAVTVSVPLQRRVMEWDEYTGHIQSPDRVNVQARVSGFVTNVTFKEGDIVHKDDVLLLIDDQPFKAELDSKKADVARAQSQVDWASVHLRRYAAVRGTNAISEDDYDTAAAALAQAKAVLAASEAAQETARLNLEWTRVTAPITGRISRKDVTTGNMVNGGGGPAPGTVLTTLFSVDPMYCYVPVPEQAFLKYHVLAEKDEGMRIRGGGIRCFIQLENETGFPHEGVIDFVDNAVDPTTGTIQLRAVIANPRGLLTPGLFARMRLPASGWYEALLVPDAAIATNQNERFLLVVGGDDVVEYRRVKLGALFGDLRAITEGLKAGERIAVNGMQMAQPGIKVSPQEVPISIEGANLTGPGSSATRPAATNPAAEKGAETQP